MFKNNGMIITCRILFSDVVFSRVVFFEADLEVRQTTVEESKQ